MRQAKKAEERELRKRPNPNNRLRSALRQLAVAGYTGAVDLRSLVEAVGVEFKALQRTEGNWVAHSRDKTLGGGSTPDEAVAKLLLTLRFAKQ